MKQLCYEKIPYLVPDMPSADELFPFLTEMDSNHWYSNFGPLADRFNHQLRSVFFKNTSLHSLLTSSGTSALEVALHGLNLRPGALVLVPAFTFPATANAIENCGFEPVFCDVDEHSWVLTPEIALEAIASNDIEAVVPVAALGRPLNSNSWHQFSVKTGLPVVIDAAPALGVQEVTGPVIAAFSLHATKAFGVGEGGVLISESSEFIDEARSRINFGMNSTGCVKARGGNAKFSEYHAAVGLAQMQRWQLLCQKRSRVELVYHKYHRKNRARWELQSFQDSVGGSSDVVSLPINPVRATMPIKLSLRPPVSVRDVQAGLQKHNIETRLWYNPGLHHHPHWQDKMRIPRRGEKHLVVVDDLNQNLLGLPFHNFLKNKEIEFIVASMIGVLNSLDVIALNHQ